MSKDGLWLTSNATRPSRARCARGPREARDGIGARLARPHTAHPAAEARRPCGDRGAPPRPHLNASIQMTTRSDRRCRSREAAPRLRAVVPPPSRDIHTHDPIAPRASSHPQVPEPVPAVTGDLDIQAYRPGPFPDEDPAPHLPAPRRPLPYLTENQPPAVQTSAVDANFGASFAIGGAAGFGSVAFIALVYSKFPGRPAVRHARDAPAAAEATTGAALESA